MAREPSRKPPVDSRGRGRPGARRGGPTGFLWGTGLAMVVVAAGLFLVSHFRHTGQEQDQPLSPVTPTLSGGAGDRAVVLVFPNLDGTGYVTEERRLPSCDRLEDDLLAVMAALCQGPTVGGAVCALPQGTHPLAAFYNEAAGSVVLDFSRELVTRHPGGSASEYATLATILRTVALNFPEVQSCLLLVDGAQSETLAGHLTLNQPFQPKRWL